MTEPIVKRAKGDGVEIQLAFWDGAGKTVLCIHGLTANCRCWDNVAQGLAPGHRVFAMDLRCPVLILRATEGMLAQDDLLLPEDVAQRMCREISNARCTDITGTNHYSIVFEPNDVRDGAIREFLAD